MVQPLTPADVIRQAHERYRAAQEATRRAAKEAEELRAARARGEGSADASGRAES